jgi:hypothetical protein
MHTREAAREREDDAHTQSSKRERGGRTRTEETLVRGGGLSRTKGPRAVGEDRERMHAHEAERQCTHTKAGRQRGSRMHAHEAERQCTHTIQETESREEDAHTD